MPEIVNRSQVHRHAAVGCALPEDVLLLKRFRGAERLGGLFEYELELVSEKPDQVDPDQVLGAPMVVRLELPDGNTRYFHGLVSRFVMVSGEDELPLYHATVVPWLWTLTRSADCRIFHDTARQAWDVPTIVLQVFRDFGASAFRNALSGTYQKLEYTVQYAETAYNFVNRLLEREGIYYFFEHTEDAHTLVLADASTAHEPFPGYDTLIYRGRNRTHPGEEHVFRWEVRKEVQPGAVALGAFNFKQPANDLTVRSTTQRPHPQSDFEVYDFPGTYIERDVGEQYARVRLDEFQCQHEVIHGEGNVRGLACGSTLKLTGMPGGDEEAEYLVTSAEYMIANDAYQSTPGAGFEEPFTCRFTAIPCRQTYRPPRVTPRPLIRGPQTATVVGPSGEEIHTDEFGRVRVQFPWDRRGQADEKSSCWIRVAQAWAGKKWGALFTPRVGQEVIVEYLEGDPDRPVITGRVYNGDNKPPYDLPANATMSTTKTLSSKGGGGFNEIRFEDKKGEEQIFIHGEKQLDVRIKKDAYEWIGETRHLIVGKDQFEKVDNNRHETVTNDHTEKIGNDRNLKVGGKQAVEITGSSSLTVTGDMVEVFKANHSEQVTQNYYVKAMGIVIEASTGVTIKCGGNSIVLDSSGVTIKGSMVTIDGGMTKINSGPGSPPTAGSAGSAVSPAVPTDPHEADTADPGEMSQARAQQLQTRTGKYGSASVTPYQPPQTPEEQAAKNSWVEIQLNDDEGNPVAGEKYRIELPDGSVKEGTLDGNGHARVSGIEPGNCKITFPDRDGSSWNPG
jgi:type VI secretion system secreted protein VgrG